MKEKSCKGRNPYTTLAIFTAAMVGVINVTNKMKRFFREKCDKMREVMSMDK